MLVAKTNFLDFPKFRLDHGRGDWVDSHRVYITPVYTGLYLNFFTDRAGDFTCICKNQRVWKGTLVKWVYEQVLALADKHRVNRDMVDSFMMTCIIRSDMVSEDEQSQTDFVSGLLLQKGSELDTIGEVVNNGLKILILDHNNDDLVPDHPAFIQIDTVRVNSLEEMEDKVAEYSSDSISYRGLYVRASKDEPARYSYYWKPLWYSSYLKIIGYAISIDDPNVAESITVAGTVNGKNVHAIVTIPKKSDLANDIRVNGRHYLESYARVDYVRFFTSGDNIYLQEPALKQVCLDTSDIKPNANNFRQL